jgi:hypothetical protein
VHLIFIEVEIEARVPPLREPTRSQERTRKKKRRLASVGMTIAFIRLGLTLV